MNKNQFIAYSLFTAVLSAACAAKGTDNGAWFIGSLAALFLWVFIFLSDRYAGQRSSILKIVLGLPLSIALIAFCIYRLVQLKQDGEDSFAVDLSSHASSKVTGNGGLNSGSFSGTLYNGSKWDVRNVRFVVTVGKDSRKFDQKINIAPRSTASFYFQTGQNQSDKVEWNMETIKGIPPKPGPEEYEKIADGDKNELKEIESLLPLTFEQRVKKMPPDTAKQKYWFWFVASTTDIKSDIFLHNSITNWREDHEEYDSALSENEKAILLVDKDSKGLSGYGVEAQLLHQRVLRELGRYDEAVEEGSKLLQQGRVLRDARIPASYAVSLEHVGRYWKAIGAWKLARELCASGPDKKEGILTYHIVSPQDRILLKFDQYRFTDMFIKQHIRQLRSAILKSLWPGALLLLLGIVAAWYFRGRRGKTAAT